MYEANYELIEKRPLVCKLDRSSSIEQPNSAIKLPNTAHSLRTQESPVLKRKGPLLKTVEVQEL